jgi:hypothetical protein
MLGMTLALAPIVELEESHRKSQEEELFFGRHFYRREGGICGSFFQLQIFT